MKSTCKKLINNVKKSKYMDNITYPSAIEDEKQYFASNVILKFL